MIIMISYHVEYRHLESTYVAVWRVEVAGGERWDSETQGQWKGNSCYLQAGQSCNLLLHYYSDWRTAPIGESHFSANLIKQLRFYIDARLCWGSTSVCVQSCCKAELVLAAVRVCSWWKYVTTSLQFVWGWANWQRLDLPVRLPRGASRGWQGQLQIPGNSFIGRRQSKQTHLCLRHKGINELK